MMIAKLSPRPMLKTAATACLVMALSAAMVARAETTSDRDGRYAIVQLDDGIARIDRISGAVDKCRDVSGKLVCTLAADEREAWLSEMETMKEKLASMERRLAVLDGKSAPKASRDTSTIDSMEEMEKAWTIAESFFRRFFNLMETLKSEKEKPEAL